jgi:N-acetylmuramoyl-L-alanine amidase
MTTRRFALPSFVALALSALILLPSTASAQDRPLVVIDAGHGGEEIGVEAGGVLEKDLVLEIAFVMGAEFARKGWDVIYTRTRDEAVAWADRQRIAEEAGAQFLIMLHANGDEDTSKQGAEVYFSADQAHSVTFAENIRDSIEDRLYTVLLEAKPWPFLASTSVATGMVELAFMTNEEDLRNLQNRQYQHELGQIMVDAAGR